MSSLIERFKRLVSRFDAKSIDPYERETVSLIIAALSPVLPDDVRGILQKNDDCKYKITSLDPYYLGRLIEDNTDLIERLARDCSEYDEREKVDAEVIKLLQRRIEEYDKALEYYCQADGWYSSGPAQTARERIRRMK